MKTIREYRKIARDQLDNQIFGYRWMFALLAMLIVTVATSLASATIIGSLAVVLLSGPIAYGTISVFSRIVRYEDQKAELIHLIDGFKEKFVESFVTGILKELYTFLWTLCLIVPGIIKHYAYSLSIYLVKFRDLTNNEAITKSRKMMYGNKFKLFVLDLSFIGWYIVGILCLGVGVFWVYPYHQLARSNFFKELMDESI